MISVKFNYVLLGKGRNCLCLATNSNRQAHKRTWKTRKFLALIRIPSFSSSSLYSLSCTTLLFILYSDELPRRHTHSIYPHPSKIQKGLNPLPNSYYAEELSVAICCSHKQLCLKHSVPSTSFGLRVSCTLSTGKKASCLCNPPSQALQT